MVANCRTGDATADTAATAEEAVAATKGAADERDDEDLWDDEEPTETSRETVLTTASAAKIRSQRVNI